jgi:hypothetical protein
MNKAAVKKRIENAIKKFATSTSQKAFSLVPQSMTSGKIYEAHVLSLVIENLSIREGFSIILVNSNHIPLKSSPGPINRRYPFFRLQRSGATVAEVWTDVEFMSLSHAQTGSSNVGRGDYHELDILVADKGVSGRPRHDQIWLGVECKNTGYSKGLLKEILGIRRELSLLQSPNRTRFTVWPRVSVPADPQSCLLVYSTDPDVTLYAGPGSVFGIDFIHEVI